MSEIETKIFGIRRELALNHLRQCARDKNIDLPEQIFNGMLTAVYYKNGDLPLIRLRTEEQAGRGSRNILTVKQPEISFHFNVKQCAEENLVIIDLAQADRMVRLLGYEPVHSIVKHRESWIYNGAKLEFDRIGEGEIWLEIETADKKHLMEVIEDLGYTLENCSSKTTEEIRDENAKEAKH